MSVHPLPDNHATTSDPRLLVELLTASGCARCQRARTLIKTVVVEVADPRITYREVNVIEQIDYAVRLGVQRVPAIALGGELAFSAIPSQSQLREAILGRLAAPSP